jgi:hypothetical protein
VELTSIGSELSNMKLNIFLSVNGEIGVLFPAYLITFFGNKKTVVFKLIIIPLLSEI